MEYWTTERGSIGVLRKYLKMNVCFQVMWSQLWEQWSRWGWHWTANPVSVCCQVCHSQSNSKHQRYIKPTFSTILAGSKISDKDYLQAVCLHSASCYIWDLNNGLRLALQLNWSELIKRSVNKNLLQFVSILRGCKDWNPKQKEIKVISLLVNFGGEKMGF